MGFEFNLILFCDSCGVEENYGEDFSPKYSIPPLPDDWKENYDDGDSIFGTVCGGCIESFKEEEGG
jgi:hypothetical protein